MPTIVKKEIEEGCAALPEDVQVKLEHPDREGERASIMQIKNEVEEDSAALHGDAQLKSERPDHERERALNMQTAMKSEIEEPAALHDDDVQVKLEHPDHERHIALFNLYVEHEFKEELVIGPVMLQNPGTSAEKLFTDTKRRFLNKTTVPSIFPWNKFASPIKCKFLTLEDVNSLSDSGPETKNVARMEPLIGSASSITSVTETASSAASDLETDYDIPTFNASGIRKTYSKQGALSCNRPRLESDHEHIEQGKKQSTEETDVTVTEDNVSETLTAEASIGVQSTESAEDKQLTAEYKAFKCDDCREKFQSKPELVQHLEIHNKTISELYLNCTECEYKTVTRDALDRHLKLHDRQRQHACETCSYRFETKLSLRSHIKDRHTVKKAFTCAICNKFKTNKLRNLEVHLRVHSGEKPFSCPQCQYKCNQQSALKTHLRIHTGEKLFSCPQCPYKCKEQDALKTHLVKHTREKPFSCPQCQFKCKYKSGLNAHLMTHTGERPFSCPQCQYKFSRQGLLKRHMITHTAYCLQCKYECTTQNHLKIHLKTHSGENPFHCQQCPYKCTTQRSLKMHLRTHISEKPVSCPHFLYR